jgi:flavodoxin
MAFVAILFFIYFIITKSQCNWRIIYMKALVIYDSYFGNTEKIAQAIGNALGPKTIVQTVKVDQAEQGMLEGIDILVVGSPTRAFSPTPAIKSFLKMIKPKGLQGVKVAAFDTRIPLDEKTPGFLRFMVRLFGYADKPLQTLMVQKGGQATVPSQGFFVTASEGPLQDGELERASAWAKQIAEV